MADREVRLRFTGDAGQVKREVASISPATAQALGQTRVAIAQQLAQIRTNTAQQLSQIRVNAAAQLNQIRQSAQNNLRQMGSQFESAGRRLTVGLTLPLAALGAAAIKSAKDIDSQVNTLRALTGSAEAAEKRYAQLVATAQKTPGLTTNLGLTLDAQLRAAKVTQETIDRILPAIGRLNAIKPIEDPQRFAENLRQIIQLNFPVKDLRELVRASPVAGQVITELFNVDSPTNAEAIRKAARRMGIRTTDEFFAAFADAAGRNKGLQNVTDSIGTAFDKMADRVAVALRPLGLAIIGAFKPILDTALPALESLGRAFNSLPSPVKTGTVAIGAFAAALGPALYITGSLINTVAALQKAYVALNTLALIPTLSNLRLLGQVMQGTAGLTAGATATMVVRFGALAAAIAAAAAVSVGLARAADGWLVSLAKTHPLIARFGQAVLSSFNPLYAVAKALGLVGPETEKVGEAQAAAVPHVKDFTEAVEEESETLRQLKRRLEEVQIATRERVADSQRAYNEERTTLAAASSARIKALEDDQTAQLAIIEQGIKERQQQLEALRGSATEGLGPHGSDDDEKVKKLLEEVAGLQLQKSKIVSETLTQVRDIESEQRMKEKELAERQGQELLSIRRINAERQIEVLRDEAERHESLKLKNERAIIQIERDLTREEIAELEKRRDAAIQGTEVRITLENELNRKLAERGRQRAEQARRIARAELEAALLPVKRESRKEGAFQSGDEGTIARLRDTAERGRSTIAASEQAVANVIDAGFARRIKNLKDEIAVRAKHNEDVAELNARLGELEQERTNASEESARRIRDGREQDLENAREHADKLIPIERALAAARLSVREAVLNATRVTFGRERALLKERYAIERERIRIAKDEAIADLTDREHAELKHARKTLGNDEDFNKRRLEIQKFYDALRKAEADKAKAATKGVDDDEVRARDPFARLKDLWTDFKEHATNAADAVRESTREMADSLVDAFTSMEGALRQGIVSWLLYGESLGKALKSALAQSLATVAADAAIQALKHAAYAIGSLAFGDASSAAKHALAAAKFGALAVAAGVAARGLANSAGLTRGSSFQAGGVAAQDAQPRNAQFNYGGNGFSTPASADAGGGSRYTGRGVTGGAIAGALNKMNATLDRLQSMPAGHVVTMGAPDAQEAIGVAVLGHSGSNDGFNDALARNMRVA